MRHSNSLSWPGGHSALLVVLTTVSASVVFSLIHNDRAQDGRTHYNSIRTAQVVNALISVRMLIVPISRRTHDCMAGRYKSCVADAKNMMLNYNTTELGLLSVWFGRGCQWLEARWRYARFPHVAHAHREFALRSKKCDLNQQIR